MDCEIGWLLISHLCQVASLRPWVSLEGASVSGRQARKGTERRFLYMNLAVLTLGTMDDTGPPRITPEESSRCTTILESACYMSG